MTRCIAIVLAAALVPGGVCAQETAQSWPGLTTSDVSAVSVVDATGAETSGRLLRLTPDAIVLLVGGTERRFEAADVRRIEKRGDSLGNGALIGTLAGVVMGFLAAGISDCPGDDPGGSCPGFRTSALLASVGVYAAIGAGVDALVVGRTTLYETAMAPPAAALAGSAPPRHRGRAAINLSVRW